MSPGRPRSVPKLGPEIGSQSRNSGKQQTDGRIAAVIAPVTASEPRISAAERCRSLFLRCKKQQKQRGRELGAVPPPLVMAQVSTTPALTAALLGLGRSSPARPVK